MDETAREMKKRSNTIARETKPSVISAAEIARQWQAMDEADFAEKAAAAKLQKPKRPDFFTASGFAAARRQLGGDMLAGWVANCEAHYRKTLGVESLLDDDVVAANLDPESRAENAARTVFGLPPVEPRSEAERAGLKVIRMCIAVREATPASREQFLDLLQIALAEADPARIEGLVRAKGRVDGNKASLEKRWPKKHRRMVELLMHNCLAKDPPEDATKHFPEWTRLYDYSVRQLRRKWRKIQAIPR